METIRVRTTQNIDIDYEIGGLGERFVARLIDYAIFLPFFFIIMFVAIANNEAGGAFAIIMYFIFVFYDLLCEVFFNGQSLGKRVMKIRVISLDGRRPKFSQYLLRWLFRLIDFAITFPGIAALISAIVTENGQRIGDIVAGTVLIRTVPRTQKSNLVYAHVPDDYVPVFTQAGELTDKEMGLIQEVLETYYRTGNNEIIYIMANKMRAHLAISLPPDMDSMRFLQTIMKDYSHISAHADAL
jgi:uncharacterized RDD family membrane protein YckC